MVPTLGQKSSGQIQEDVEDITLLHFLKIARAGDVAQAVARSPGMRAARVRSSSPHTNKDVVSAEN